MKNVFIISGAAGSGKDAVIDGLQAILPIERVITTTTRAPRPTESEGHPYCFLSPEAFQSGIAAGDFVEYSINENGEWYGVTQAELDRIAKKKCLAIWRVDWKGVVAIKKLYPDIPALYISAPLSVLEARLRARDLDKDKTYFSERMAYTREWLKHLDIYDYSIENEQGHLEKTIARVVALIQEHQQKHTGQ
ncbi:MAG: hypothetical protein KBA91_02105 [Candidatus Moranbacteria bacterium]|jgi:guanylate kinase|nr:hypothetical protein [Candidatus Moranbacteria bacterium]